MIPELISRRLERLRDFEEYPCLTVYSPPFPPVSEESESVPEELQKWIQTIQKELDEKMANDENKEHYKAQIQEQIFAPLKTKRRYESVAHFISPELEIYFHFPFALKPKVYVGDHFLLDPILFALYRSVHYLILILSEKNTRFIEYVNGQIIEYHPKHLPKGYKDVVSEYDLKQITSPPDIPMGEADRAILMRSIEIQLTSVMNKYLKKVDEYLHEAMKDETLRLVIIGSNKFIHAYQEICSIKDKVVAFVIGAYDFATPGEIYDFVKPLIEAEENNIQNVIPFEIESAQAVGLIETTIQGAFHSLYKDNFQKLLLNKEFFQSLSDFPVYRDLVDVDDIENTNILDVLAKYAHEVACPVVWTNGSLLQGNPLILIREW